MKRNFSAARPLTSKKPVPPADPPKPKPEWNENFSLSENPHKISQVEVLQRKLNAKSKNEQAAREEL